MATRNSCIGVLGKSSALAGWPAFLAEDVSCSVRVPTSLRGVESSRGMCTKSCCGLHMPVLMCGRPPTPVHVIERQRPTFVRMTNYNIDSQGNILQLLTILCLREDPDLISLKGFIRVVTERPSHFLVS